MPNNQMQQQQQLTLQQQQQQQQQHLVNSKTKTALANMLSIRLQNGVAAPHQQPTVSTSQVLHNSFIYPHICITNSWFWCIYLLLQQIIPGQPDISAAGQLRMITAQHHAAQQRIQPPPPPPPPPTPMNNTQSQYQVICSHYISSKLHTESMRLIMNFMFIATKICVE